MDWNPPGGISKSPMSQPVGKETRGLKFGVRERCFFPGAFVLEQMRELLKDENQKNKIRWRH